MIDSAAALIEQIQKIGFLPLLESGIPGYCAEDIVDDDCRYVVFADGGWDWPLWKWKGPVVSDGKCVYGKFFAKKAGFVSLEWWPDLYNYRRSMSPPLEPDSVEEMIIATLQEQGSMITRQLRNACGFTGPKMRGLFDGYITRLQMACHIVTQDFVYPLDKRGREYGWGWSLLTTPEILYGREACLSERTAEESYQKIFDHLTSILPHANGKQIERFIKI